MAYERTCVVCGASYQYCGSCPAYATLEPWHNLYHDENCRDIFQVCSEYASGSLSAEDAGKRLSGVKIPEFTLMRPGVKKNLQEILKAAKREPAGFVEQIAPVEATAEAAVAKAAAEASAEVNAVLEAGVFGGSAVPEDVAVSEEVSAEDGALEEAASEEVTEEEAPKRRNKRK